MRVVKHLTPCMECLEFIVEHKYIVANADLDERHKQFNLETIMLDYMKHKADKH